MMETVKAENFAAFPISEKSKNGLFDAGYKQPTQIQKDSIAAALQGQDVFGAAKTGSGKTLAFVLPMLELLEREKWTKVDGLGALVITPTRELAYQIFEVIKKVGKFHDFSLGLVIGGKDLKFEWNRLHVCNIIIATPGRLLQHMDKNQFFCADNLKLLVLDEADRILDMGFAETMDAVFANLPKNRQTLLFSATPSKSVKDLARVNLKKPVYISVHEKSTQVTPESLNQSYVVVDLNNKINVLWSFLKSHLHNKIIVFFSTCKQTNFIYELFSQMKLKTTFLCLYGTMHQLRRMDVYDEFCRKPNAILFATDIASRGLDFPDLNWVVQFDCPENTNAYIHRVGRTARYKKGGEALLFLLPSEEDSMVDQLRDRKIPIEKIEIRPDRIKSIQDRAAALLASDLDLKERAQRCFKTYLKSYYFMKNKSVFDLTALDFEAYAHSLGLEVSPRLRVLEQNKVLKNKIKQNQHKRTNETSDSTNVNSSQDNQTSETNQSSVDDAMQKPKFDVPSDSDDELLVFKGKLTADNVNNEGERKPLTSNKRSKSTSKEAKAKKLLKRNIVLNTKKRFYGDSDDDLSDAEYDFKADYDINYAKDKLVREDEKDKKAYRAVIRKRTMDAKMRAKMELIEQMEEKAKQMGVNLSGKEKVDEDEQMEDTIEDNGSSELETEDSEQDANDHEQMKTQQEISRTQQIIDQLPDPDLIHN